MKQSNDFYQRYPLNFVTLYHILLLLYRNSIYDDIVYIVSYTVKRNIKTDQRISNIKCLTLVSSMSLKQLSIVWNQTCLIQCVQKILLCIQRIMYSNILLYLHTLVLDILISIYVLIFISLDLKLPKIIYK